ncbi:hypothetical protein [Halopseudomonas salegens]|uniref:Uncharacterized protein n=1 Tax=Halopseudomonas salegens TaxID=1434072 RepID=A0A1H2FBA9_9GAMM|nr:hypothetical protein [Halopseudomonas salegens]SDU04670.1 hypothetical protein SAMN05216210_1433 [Halopseudomonas salegens]
MTEHAEEAARALREIELIKERVAGFQDYQAESHQLVLWGFVHVIGYALSALVPEYILLSWLGVLTFGILTGLWLARGSKDVIPGIVWRYLLVIGSILLFVCLIHFFYFPLPPTQGALAGPLFIGCLYLIRGAQVRPRYIFLGATLILVCLIAHLLLQAWFWWWMSLAFGGGLMLFGLWLRRY